MFELLFTIFGIEWGSIQWAEWTFLIGPRSPSIGGPQSLRGIFATLHRHGLFQPRDVFKYYQLNQLLISIQGIYFTLGHFVSCCITTSLAKRTKQMQIQFG